MSNPPKPINVFAETLDRVRAAARAVVPSDTDLSRIQVEPPRDASHGDIATNAAMVLAKGLGKNPLELANAIRDELKKHEPVADAVVAKPGFINLTLVPGAWTQELRRAVAAGCDYGKSDVGAHVPVNVEFVSANPTGPMHVGHCRGAVFGDALASLLDFTGFKVTREYYINDAGAQVDVLARSAFLRYREALSEDIGAIPEGLYPGDYLKPVGAALAAEHADTFSERSLIAGDADRVAATIEWLRQRGYVYEGRLPPPKGAPAEDWEDREQTLFRSTDFGDDVDRALKKSDGSYTYFASDIAYHRSKIERGFSTLIDVWGADHGGYIKRMQAAVAALSDRKVDLDVKVIQLVKLLRAGEPVKMSKRSGEFVTLREVVDEVGSDAVRFMMLYRKNDAALDFDLAKVLEQSRDNPVFYVQYGHARAQSVFRNARTAFPDLPADLTVPDALWDAPLDRLSDPAELALMRRIALYPRIVEAASLAHEPHRIAFYLFELASEFHALWTQGNASPHLRFIIQDDRQLTKARLVLVQGVATVLASGLALLGVKAPNEMR
jgi:arginyl-tRNA synthetase